jgi:hypothetical protein
MIKAYVSDLAAQMGLKLHKVLISGGPLAACIDYRLEITSHTHVVSTMIHRSELDSIERGSCSGFLELKVRTALERLKMQMEP